MADAKDPEALTDDGRAPVLSEDQAETPIEGEDAANDEDKPKAIDLPIEENDFNSQPG